MRITTDMLDKFQDSRLVGSSQRIASVHGYIKTIREHFPDGAELIADKFKARKGEEGLSPLAYAVFSLSNEMGELHQGLNNIRLKYYNEREEISERLAIYTEQIFDDVEDKFSAELEALTQQRNNALLQVYMSDDINKLNRDYEMAKAALAAGRKFDRKLIRASKKDYIKDLKELAQRKRKENQEWLAQAIAEYMMNVLEEMLTPYI